MSSRLGTVSAKAIFLVIGLIILCVVCNSAWLLWHFQAAHGAVASAVEIGIAEVVIGALLAGFCFPRLLAPLKGLCAVIEDIKAGRYDRDVPYLRRHDEFGAAARRLRALNRGLQKESAAATAREKAGAETAAGALAAQRRSERLVVTTFDAGFTALAQGNLDYRMEAALPEPYRTLQQSFNHAIVRLGEIREAEAERARQLKDTQAQLTREQVAAAEKAQQHAMERVVSSFRACLQALAVRDLSVRIHADLPAGYDALKSAYNGAMDVLAGAMADIGVRAADIAASTSELSQATQNMAQRTERQAASLEETASAMEEVTANVKKSAENAGEASKSAADAHKNAEQGNAVAKDTIAAMRNIAESSAEITQIIGVIDDIAFQTNLLALNAGVEAARAGDSGRGFAVVATEVRSLAQRSAEAAKQIKGLVHTSQHQVEKGVKLVEKSGEALDGIVKDVGRISILMTEIATAQKVQSNAFAEINAAVSSMDQTTQQNAAMNEEGMAANAAIAKQSRELADLIGSFISGRRGEGRQALMQAPDPVAPAAETLAAE